MQIQTRNLNPERVKIEITDDLKKCSQCDRVPTCAVFRAVDPLLKGWEPELVPFDTEQLAKICRWFVLAERSYRLKK